MNGGVIASLLKMINTAWAHLMNINSETSIATVKRTFSVNEGTAFKVYTISYTYK